MTAVSISRLNDELLNNNYREIVKDRDLFWMLFCSVRESEHPYFNIQKIDHNTIIAYGDLDVIRAFKRFIGQIQDIFKKAIKHDLFAEFITVVLDSDIYLSQAQPTIDLTSCDRFYLPHIMNCALPRLLKMTDELQIGINRKHLYRMLQNGFTSLACETSHFTVTFSNLFKKNRFASDHYALFAKQEMCDMTFVLPQGTVKAHRSVLALYGGVYFKQELKREIPQMQLEMVTQYTFKAFLTYVYLGQNSFQHLREDKILDLRELQKFADFCQVERLSTFCNIELNKRNLRIS